MNAPRCRAGLAGMVVVGMLGMGVLMESESGSARGENVYPAPGPNSPDEPIAGTLSLARAGAFLDAASVDWTRKRQCGTCHTNYNYLMSRPMLPDGGGSGLAEVRVFFESRVAGWDDDEPGAAPRWDAEVVATASALAIHDAHSTGRLHPRTRDALDRMWTLQQPDGAWEWLKCDWPPYEHDDYYGAVLAALGVGLAPEAYQHSDAARDGLDKLRRYLSATEPPSPHHQAMLLWASQHLDGLMTPEQQQRAIADLLALQRPDGGWNLPSLGDWDRHDGSPNDPDGPSDGFATGFVVYVLRQAGLPAEHEAIARGVDWLQSHQRVSGRWFTRSLNNDKDHYITHAGTGFAVMALRACGVGDK